MGCSSSVSNHTTNAPISHTEDKASRQQQQEQQQQERDHHYSDIASMTTGEIPSHPTATDAVSSFAPVTEVTSPDTQVVVDSDNDITGGLDTATKTTAAPCDCAGAKDHNERPSDTADMFFSSVPGVTSLRLFRRVRKHKKIQEKVAQWQEGVQAENSVLSTDL